MTTLTMMVGLGTGSASGELATARRRYKEQPDKFTAQTVLRLLRRQGKAPGYRRIHSGTPAPIVLTCRSQTPHPTRHRPHDPKCDCLSPKKPESDPQEWMPPLIRRLGGILEVYSQSAKTISQEVYAEERTVTRTTHFIDAQKDVLVLKTVARCPAKVVHPGGDSLTGFGKLPEGASSMLRTFPPDTFVWRDELSCVFLESSAPSAVAETLRASLLRFRAALTEHTKEKS